PRVPRHPRVTRVPVALPALRADVVRVRVGDAADQHVPRGHLLASPLASRSLEGVRALTAGPSRIARALPVAVLVLLNAALFRLFYGSFGDLVIDSFRELTVPIRILHGQMPYRDFFYEYGPLAPYVC